MTLDRIFGATTALFGLSLLFYLIPQNVDVRAGQPLDPSLFPRIAAWIFIILGALLTASPSPEGKLPSFKGAIVAFGVLACIAAAVISFKWFGFLPSSIGLMGVIALVVGEHRPMWLIVIIIGIPVSIWALFELLLQRSLP